MNLDRDIPQYFFDDSWIAEQKRLVRRWLSAKIFPRPIVEPDTIQEGRTLGLYGTVIRTDPDQFRMYYNSFLPVQVGTPHMKLFMATSEDGFSWQKPEIGLIDQNTDRRSNAVMIPEASADSSSLIHEPDDAEYPYKMVAFENDPDGGWLGPRWGLYGYLSNDGVQWSRLPNTLLQAGDRTNMMASRPEGKYVLYTRDALMYKDPGLRAIYRSESEDFTNWSRPELVLAPDLTDEPDVEFYGMSVFERNGWYFGLLEYWRAAVDIIETYLLISRDGRHWMRPYPWKPFIGSEYYWNRAWSSCASNGMIVIGEQMVFYFGGRFVSHHFDTAHQHGAIGYASLPVDRFCALEGTTGGEFTTPPFEWPGGDLVLNCDTRESYDSHPLQCSGEIRVEVLTPEGNHIPEWSGEKSAVIRQNTHCRCTIRSGKVQWSDERSLDLLAKETVRLRFHLKHARLFTLEAAQK